MRGRYPLRLEEAVAHMDASAVARERLKVIVATLVGQCRMQQACAQLGISEPRLQQLRQQLLQGALASLEPGQAGRPAKVPTAAELRVRQLEAELAALRRDYQAALVRAEINAVLPQVVHETASAEKKRQRRRRSAAGPLVGGRTPETAGRLHGTRPGWRFGSSRPAWAGSATAATAAGAASAQRRGRVHAADADTGPADG